MSSGPPADGLAPARTGFWRTGPTPPGPTGTGCAPTTSTPRSRLQHPASHRHRTSLTRLRRCHLEPTNPNNRPRQFASADAAACCSMLVWSGSSPAKRLSGCSDLTEDYRLYLTYNECCIMPLRHTRAPTLIIDIVNQALIYESE